ncbi:hypothetical protein UB31_01315 [Bradyrhizobium sp. LTSP849]|uniref:TIGR02391 family protein n=1 Tax=Bradyrhizobium sp. LTSP849 TaxID=1615890 RepID=UPI0005D2A08F|nr:TIGR02391 family protein [Bradyrhizobium sp. LTSP849]KJC55147.1 hypothetical protein UB31_01315 [Bradyrhizobium sp. LTSP849]
MSFWAGIDKEIWDASAAIAEAGKFDDAIFAAFRLLEAEIQQRIDSSSIGQALLDEAFDGSSPKIDISPNARDRVAMKQLFTGALGNIRNDRGHKKAPLIPCRTNRECLLYLQFATLLLELLKKDRNTFPSITRLRVFGTPDSPLLELRGRNFDKASEVLNETTNFNVRRWQNDLLEISLPPGFCGELFVKSGENTSNVVHCDTRLLTTERENSYRIIATDLTLFEDETGTTKREDVVGMLLLANESGTEFHRIQPTLKGRYQDGDFVTHGPFSAPIIGQNWVSPSGTNGAREGLGFRNDRIA